MFRFVDRKEVTFHLKMKATTLRKYRMNGGLIEGIHWIKFNSRCILYNLELLQDWVHNQNDQAAHQRAIARYQATLPSG
jgi:tRNA(His) 5'-end guanylyltransferase